MSAKHTPGPWTTHHDHGWLVVESETGDLYVKVEKGSTAQKHMADARLIAAAPDLLAVLQTIVANERERHGYHPSWTDQARAAIAKVTGENQ